MISSEKQSVEKSKMSEREMTIPTEDPIENVVVAVNQTDESVERFSFNLKAEEMIKSADSTKENMTSLLEEKLASLQRELDTTLKQLATSKTLQPRAFLRGGQVFGGEKRGLIRLEPRDLLRGRQLPQELEPIRLVTNVLTDSGDGSRMMSTDTTGEDGSVMFTQTNSVEERPVRYFYFI